MERQRSFAFKSTKFLAFSFTLSFSIIFLLFFTIWLFKSNPPVFQDASFQFQLNTSSFVLGLKPISAVSLTAITNISENKFEDSVLTQTHLFKTENASGFSSILVLANKSISELVGTETVKTAVNSNSTYEKSQDTSSLNSTSNDGALEKIKVTSFESNEGSKARKGPNSIQNFEDLSKKRVKKKNIKECDITKGKWVYDETYEPYYTDRSCPFIDEGFDCVGNGRLDKDFMKWRWQPQDCDIPRFNASEMLDLIRGKRLVFVGDSINRNQWESMLCMLYQAVKDPKMVYETRGRKITKEKGIYSFKFVEYKCTVEYYVSHFLVHETKARVGQRRVQTLRIDAIDHGSSRWKGANILIFNSAHWWSHFKTKAGINYYQEGNLVHPKLDVSNAFRRAIKTWASWVDRYINQRKTQVFFRSSAPSHFRGGQWNSGGHCNKATLPLNDTSGVEISEKNAITEDVIKHMKTPVSLLNVTSLSAFRVDGHPSIFGKTASKRYTSNGQDCSHWCLPGIPDTWNELLYFHLQNKQGNGIQ